MLRRAAGLRAAHNHNHRPLHFPIAAEPAHPPQPPPKRNPASSDPHMLKALAVSRMLKAYIIARGVIDAEEEQALAAGGWHLDADSQRQLRAVARAKHAPAPAPPPPPPPAPAGHAVPATAAVDACKASLLEQELACATEWEKLLAEEAQLLATFTPTAAPAAPAALVLDAAQPGTLAALGPEFDPMTAELEASPDICALRDGLLRALEDNAAAAAQASEPTAVAAAREGLGGMQGPGGWQREARRLQAQWCQVTSSCMHLQVRIAQLRQLPHQPKRKLTLAAVREQHASYLYNRQSLLNQRTSEMAAQARGM